jgi:hypothetical protein
VAELRAEWPSALAEEAEEAAGMSAEHPDALGAPGTWADGPLGALLREFPRAPAEVGKTPLNPFETVMDPVETLLKCRRPAGGAAARVPARTGRGGKDPIEPL